MRVRGRRSAPIIDLSRAAPSVALAVCVRRLVVKEAAALSKLVVAVALMALVVVGTVVVASARGRSAVSDVSFAPRTFAVSAGAGSSPGRGRATTIRLRLSSRGTVKVTLARRLNGRRWGRRCVAPTRALRTRLPCARYVGAGALVRAHVDAGRVELPFSGRIRGRALAPGRYRATVTISAGGRGASRPHGATFTVVAAVGQGGAPMPSTSSAGFPNPSNTGVPAGWRPAQVRTTDLHVTQPGAVVEGIEMQNANILVEATGVTIRDVRVRGGGIFNAGAGRCAGDGLLVEDTTIEPPPGSAVPTFEHYVVGEGGYTLRRVKIDNVGDGPRISYAPEGCGPVRIEDTFIRVTQPPGGEAWHTDGIQGWYAPPLTVRNVTIDARGYPGIGSSSAFFYPSQHNTSATIDGLLVAGGAYSFRLGEPGTVRNLRIADRSWIYGPNDSKCSVIASWEAQIVEVDWSTYQPTAKVRDLRCTTEGGS